MKKLAIFTIVVMVILMTRCYNNSKSGIRESMQKAAYEHRNDAPVKEIYGWSYPITIENEMIKMVGVMDEACEHNFDGVDYTSDDFAKPMVQQLKPEYCQRVIKAEYGIEWIYKNKEGRTLAKVSLPYNRFKRIVTELGYDE
mgnify:CR=1 FL=1